MTNDQPANQEPEMTIEEKMTDNALGQRDTESRIIVDETSMIVRSATRNHGALDDATTALIHAVVESQAMLAEQIARVANSLERMEIAAAEREATQ